MALLNGAERSPVGRSALAGGACHASHGGMSEPNQSEPADANAVLRGGPLDGIRVTADNRKPLTLQAGEMVYVYRPLGETDSEYPELAVYVFNHTEDR